MLNLGQLNQIKVYLDHDDYEGLDEYLGHIYIESDWFKESVEDKQSEEDFWKLRDLFRSYEWFIDNALSGTLNSKGLAEEKKKQIFRILSHNKVVSYRDRREYYWK